MHYINNNIKLIWYIRKLICLFWRLVKMEMENFESSPLFPCNFIKGQCTVCSDFAVDLRHQWISSTFTRDSFLYVWFNRRVKRFGNHFSLGVISIPKAWESNLVAWFATCTARKDYSLSSHWKRVVHALGTWELGISRASLFVPMKRTMYSVDPLSIYETVLKHNSKNKHLTAKAFAFTFSFFKFYFPVAFWFFTFLYVG